MSLHELFIGIIFDPIIRKDIKHEKKYGRHRPHC